MYRLEKKSLERATFWKLNKNVEGWGGGAFVPTFSGPENVGEKIGKMSIVGGSSPSASKRLQYITTNSAVLRFEANLPSDPLLRYTSHGCGTTKQNPFLASGCHCANPHGPVIHGPYLAKLAKALKRPKMELPGPNCVSEPNLPKPVHIADHCD